jgi:hypothetical protein
VMASTIFPGCIPPVRAQDRLGRSRHQFISWAASGADDTSPCCEQFNLLRIAPSSQPLSLVKDRRLKAQTIPLGC